MRCVHNSFLAFSELVADSICPRAGKHFASEERVCARAVSDVRSVATVVHVQSVTKTFCGKVATVVLVSCAPHVVEAGKLCHAVNFIRYCAIAVEFAVRKLPVVGATIGEQHLPSAVGIVVAVLPLSNVPVHNPPHMRFGEVELLRMLGITLRSVRKCV